MNKKELAEIRRRIKPDKSNIRTVHGCYINGQKQIISRFSDSLAVIDAEIKEKYISLLRKGVSGSFGKTLSDINFSTKSVQEGEEHKLLNALRRSKLEDETLLDAFFHVVADNVSMGDDNYLVLIAVDTYDVPSFSKDGERAESQETFTYLLCSVCPVKTANPVLSYSYAENRFCNQSLTQVVGSPEIGFMFPAFDDRTANIYSALFYSKSQKDEHKDFVDAVFNTTVPVPPAQQKNFFGSILKDSLSDECTVETIQNIHSELKSMIEYHKESKVPDNLTLTAEDFSDMLIKHGMDETKKIDVINKCVNELGENGIIYPENIIDTKRIEIASEHVVVKVESDFASMIRTEEIGGKKYILIPAEAGVEVNGIAIKI